MLTCPCSRAPPSRHCPRGLRLSSQPRALLKVWFYVSAQYSRRRICGQAGPPFSQPRAQRLFPGPRAPGAPTVTARLLSRDLNCNQLHEFPVAIQTLGRLQEL